MAEALRFDENEGYMDTEREIGAEKSIKTESTLGSLDVRYASARAFHILKKRYCLQQTQIDGNDYFCLQSKTRAFDSILRRSPSEVCKSTSDFKIPLGKVCVQAVVSLYGLSNGAIYLDSRWQIVLSQYLENPCEATAQAVVTFLKAAATLKSLEVSGGRKSAADDDLGFCLELGEVDEKLIVALFLEMVR